MTPRVKYFWRYAGESLEEMAGSYGRWTNGADAVESVEGHREAGADGETVALTSVEFEALERDVEHNTVCPHCGKGFDT